MCVNAISASWTKFFLRADAHAARPKDFPGIAPKEGDTLRTSCKSFDGISVMAEQMTSAETGLAAFSIARFIELTARLYRSAAAGLRQYRPGSTSMRTAAKGVCDSATSPRKPTAQSTLTNASRSLNAIVDGSRKTPSGLCPTSPRVERLIQEK